MAAIDGIKGAEGELAESATAEDFSVVQDVLVGGVPIKKPGLPGFFIGRQLYAACTGISWRVSRMQFPSPM